MTPWRIIKLLWRIESQCVEMAENCGINGDMTLMANIPMAQ
jgi:hypothetical protein